jgi:pyruvate/2-oxoglutarate dehydrogenase complex dihydrolipoamide dehydrogenase (E3) component
MPDYDLAVIGAGAAGLSVTAAAAQLGLNVVLIERERMGGDCLNVGCVPSKALLAAAHAASAARAAERFGVRLPAARTDWPKIDWPQIDWEALRAHVHGAIAAIEPMDSAARYRALGATVLEGEARFLDPATIAADGRTVTARRYVVAAGSRAVLPPIPGLERVPALTHAGLFATLPRAAHLLVLGGGRVGLEMAAAYAGLGCRVTVVEQGQIAAGEDTELVDALRAALVRQGVRFAEGAAVIAASAGPTLHLADGVRITGSHLLVAAGRAPNLEALALDAGGIAYGPNGIATRRDLRSTTNRRVYAAGDIADPDGLGPRGFTHVGSYHAAVIVRRAIFRVPARVDYAALPRVIYTAPELAQVGLTEAEVRERGGVPRVLRWPLAENDRAIAERDVAGMVKLVVVRGRVVGAGILAPHAGEMIGQWALAIAARTRLSTLAGLIAPYPTRAEAGKRAAGSYFAASLFSPRIRTLARALARLP